MNPAAPGAVVPAGLKPSEWYALQRYAWACLPNLDWYELGELRHLVARALRADHGLGRTALTLDQRISLRGLVQAADVEESRRRGHVRNGGRDSRPRSREQRELSKAIGGARPLTPEERARVGRALHVVGRALDREAEELGHDFGAPAGVPALATAVRPLTHARRRRARRTVRGRGARKPGRQEDPDPPRPAEATA